MCCDCPGQERAAGAGRAERTAGLRAASWEGERPLGGRRQKIGSPQDLFLGKKVWLPRSCASFVKRVRTCVCVHVNL